MPAVRNRPRSDVADQMRRGVRGKVRTAMETSAGTCYVGRAMPTAVIGVVAIAAAPMTASPPPVGRSVCVAVRRRDIPIGITISPAAVRHVVRFMIIIPPATMIVSIAVAVSIAIATTIVRTVTFAIAGAVVAAAGVAATVGDPAAIAVAVATQMPPVAMSVGVAHPITVARNSPDARPRRCSTNSMRGRSVNGAHGRRPRSMNGDCRRPMPDLGPGGRRTARAE
jgi:hypothetical protein